MPRPYTRVRKRVWLHKSKSLGSLQNLKMSNEITKWCLLEYCSSERIYVLPFESSSFTILWLLCAVCFRTFCNNWKSFLCTHSVLVVVVGPYTFESRIHKVAVVLPNIIQGLVGIQLCTLFLLQMCLTDGTANKLQLVALSLLCNGTIVRLIFQ